MSTYKVVHLKCVKRLISSAVLWCVASTRTRPRNLITTMPSSSRTELRCLNCTCLWLHDRRANHLLGPPVIDAKAGAVSWSFRYPSRTRFTDMQQWIRYCRSRSNIIMFVFSKRWRAKRNPNVAVANARVVRFLRVLARLLHETNLLLFNN